MALPKEQTLRDFRLALNAQACLPVTASGRPLAIMPPITLTGQRLRISAPAAKVFPRLLNVSSRTPMALFQFVNLSRHPRKVWPQTLKAPAQPMQDLRLRLRHGDVSGSIIVRFKTERPSSTNEVQLNLGNPANEADWHTAQIIKGRKAILSGLTPGAAIWARVRTVGLKGVMSAWSDPGQIRVV